MSTSLLDQIVDAVLYEGYILYPYRASSQKNRQRFTFGRVYPEAYSAAQNGVEPWVMQTECLLRCLAERASITVSVRFLHPMARELGEGTLTDFRVIPEVRVDGDLFQTWLEAVEREIVLPKVALPAGGGDTVLQSAFRVPFSSVLEPLRDRQERIAGVVRRRQEAVEGAVEFVARPLDSHVFKITVRVLNRTRMQAAELGEKEAVTMRTFASTHTILRAEGAGFISLMSPPVEHKQAAADCQNIGTWPVLVGDEEKGERDTMLSSPIILYDYPKVASESPGPLFDGTEIDELLTLRVMTLTDAEKREMRQVDEYARRLLERTEALPEDDLLRMHGAMRNLNPFEENIFGGGARLEGVTVGGLYLRAGDRVRLRPKGRTDILDLAMEGKTALIEGVEQDAENRVHLAVVLEEDPGKDLGLMRQPGHRFFYGVDEVEPLQAAEPPIPGMSTKSKE